jgi:hypothetical protein
MSESCSPVPRWNTEGRVLVGLSPFLKCEVEELPESSSSSVIY